MSRRVMGHNWEWMPPLSTRTRSHKARLDGCLNENGNPKIRWPNAATARWYRDNVRVRSLKKCEPYHCPTCGRWHLGTPRSPRRPPMRMPLAGLWRSHQSMVDAPEAR